MEFGENIVKLLCSTNVSLLYVFHVSMGSMMTEMCVSIWCR